MQINNSVLSGISCGRKNSCSGCSNPKQRLGTFVSVPHSHATISSLSAEEIPSSAPVCGLKCLSAVKHNFCATFFLLYFFKGSLGGLLGMFLFGVQDVLLFEHLMCELESAERKAIHIQIRASSVPLPAQAGSDSQMK